MIRVVIADDQGLVRVGCRALFDAEADIEVVGEAETGPAALTVVRETRPDVVLMDIRMPGIDGLEATADITADPTLAGVRILILTTFEIDEYVFRALRSGASGFLLKEADPDEIVKAVRVDGVALAARERFHLVAIALITYLGPVVLKGREQSRPDVGGGPWPASARRFV